jgi:nitroreductase
MSKSIETDLLVLQSIQDRWSPRAFNPKPIPEIEIQSMLEALHWSSSCFNEQLWQLVITNRGEDRHQVLLGCMSERNRSWAQQAAILC